MIVWSEGQGFALVFESPEDLDKTIKGLIELKKERAKSKKSWPAFHGVFSKSGTAYGKQKLLWLRWVLRRGEWVPK